MLELEQIRIDGGTQSRVELNQETVAEYAQAFTDGAEFPPVVVFFDGASYWLADGFHRYFGARDAGESAIAVQVINGTQRDAVLYSWGANDKHGLPRSNADKRHIVTAILRDEQGRQWSDRDIAKRFGFSNTFVGNIRRSLSTVDSEKPAERTYTTKHGTTAVMNTANIGVQQHREAAKARHEEDIERGGHGSARPPVADKVEPEDDGPSEEEIAAHAAAEAADRELVAKLLESDKPLAALAAENKQLKAEVAQLKLARDSYMNRANEAIALVKSRDRQIAKLEKMLKETA